MPYCDISCDGHHRGLSDSEILRPVGRVKATQGKIGGGKLWAACSSLRRSDGSFMRDYHSSAFLCIVENGIYLNEIFSNTGCWLTYRMFGAPNSTFWTQLTQEAKVFIQTEPVNFSDAAWLAYNMRVGSDLRLHAG